ncbi:LexA family transcriptional regulator [Sphingobacterium kyonggiense]
MNHQGDYIKSILRNRGISQEELAKKLGMSRVSLGNRLSQPVYQNTDEKLKIVEILQFTEKEKEALDQMGGYPSLSTSPLSGNEPIEISPGRWQMMVELVPVYAQAGYLSGYGDDHFLEELPKHSFTTNVLAKGKYRAFEVAGDSMDNGNIKEAIPDGIVVVGREVEKQYWTSKFHTHKWPNWLFVHRTEGVVVKQIASQNLENGDITLRSLNPDKEKYPDFTINLDDVNQVYNVIRREIDEQQ